MIAADTSSLVAFLEGETGSDVAAIESALSSMSLFLPPPVLAEILSDPGLPTEVKDLLKVFPLLEIKEGFWIRAGELRAKAVAKGRKARLGDSLIAQVCIDHDMPLISRDKDFKVLTAVSSLKII